MQTAVLKLRYGILLTTDNGNLSALALPNLTAAFDMVDHDILRRRLNITYCLNETVLNWFKFYLIGRRQRVRIGSTFPSLSVMFCGASESSVLCPMLFLLHTTELFQLIESHCLCQHLYHTMLTIHRSTNYVPQMNPITTDPSLGMYRSCCWVDAFELPPVERSEDRILWSLVNS